jgi:general stress protein 26
MTELTAEGILKIAGASMLAAENCFLITVTASGRPAARMMLPFEAEDDLTIWMAASPTSRKVAEIRTHDQVALAYDHAEEGAYVTVLGTATIVDDLGLRKRYWRRRFIQFWPDGPDGDDYVLIKVVPTRLEMMNVTQGITADPYCLKVAAVNREGEEWLLDLD